MESCAQELLVIEVAHTDVLYEAFTHQLLHRCPSLQVIDTFIIQDVACLRRGKVHEAAAKERWVKKRRTSSFGNMLSPCANA